MSERNNSAFPPHLLLIGASRGLGLALAEEFLMRGWEVTATIRKAADPALSQLVERFQPRLHIEKLDITQDHMIESLRSRLDSSTNPAQEERPDRQDQSAKTGDTEPALHARRAKPFDMLFVNAGMTNDAPDTPIGRVDMQDFVQVMLTNALAPMRIIDRLEGLITPTGLIGVMSSGQGSIANNESGLRELYRGSKAALNQFMRCYAARIAVEAPRPLAVIAPGWVRTSLGGPKARFSVAETIPGVADVLLAHREQTGLIYRDFNGRDVPW